MPIPNELLAALVRLRHDPDFGLFLKELEARKEAARNDLEVQSDLLLIGRSQGVSNAMQELLELTRTAGETLGKRQGRIHG